MSNVFQKVANKFGDSYAVLVVQVACLIGIAISIAAFVSDYNSSYEGYIRLPTQKVPEVVWLIAFLPQVGQVVFGALFTLNFEKVGNKIKANWVYLIIVFFLFLLDCGTDVWYKTYSGTANFFVWIIAIIESITIYTIGSEILLMASLTLFMHLIPDSLKMLGQLFAVITGQEDSGQSQRR